MGGAAMGRCGAMVLDRAGLAARLVGECDGFEILYPGIVAVTGANPVAPRTAVERLGRSLAFPHIDAAGDVALFPADELLADEAWGLEEIGRDPGEVFAALLEPDRFRQIVENNGSYHGRSSLLFFVPARELDGQFPATRLCRQIDKNADRCLVDNGARRDGIRARFGYG